MELASQFGVETGAAEAPPKVATAAMLAIVITKPAAIALAWVRRDVSRALILENNDMIFVPLTYVAISISYPFHLRDARS
jgi:hypothetical protein